jgi:uncharacterized protein YjbI with pentapeptide repeats
VLNRANLKGVSIRGTDFNRGQLVKADLRDAALLGPNFRGADLSGADLTGARLFEAVFGNTNLSGANLERCEHLGRSTIDIRTIELSGSLPLSFLRGCGLSDKLIAYLPSLLNEAIQFYSCFISYSTKDQEFADRLHADLQSNAVRCWFAPHDITGGKKIDEQIDGAILMYDRLLLILSENSMKSSWVQTEISKARKRELGDGWRMLFPVRLVEFEKLADWECLDPETGKDSAREIREYFIPDFSKWKEHDEYKKAFDRLLRDLKSKGEATARPA